MRHSLLTLPLILMPAFAMAEQAHLPSSISAVTVYGSGATLIRDVDLAFGAGQHRILINLPADIMGDSLRVLGENGLQIGVISIDDRHETRAERANLMRDSIKAELDAQKADLRALQEDRSEIELTITAANTRIAMLRAIGGQQAAGAATPEGLSGAALSDLVAVVGNETLSALQDIQAAQHEITGIDLIIAEATERLAELDADYEAAADHILLSIDLTVSEGFDGAFQLKYLSSYATWRPNYTLHLNSETGVLLIDRQVTLQQETGETWENAAISVSTSQPGSNLSYRQLYGQKVSYYKPEPQAETDDECGGGGCGSLAYTPPEAVAMEAPRIATTSFRTNGLSASFALPAGTVVSGDAAEVSILVDQADFNAEITARVAVFQQQTTYLYAEFTNESALPYLPGPAVFYRDGAFAGRADLMPSIAIGQQIDLGFGKIDGLVVDRRIINRETGESGVLTTRNDSIDEYKITVENLTSFDWDMIIYDRVPYSEQEDLEIEYSAEPRPSETNIDGRRGVLAWEFPLMVGDKSEILFSYGMEWPDGMELRR